MPDVLRSLSGEQEGDLRPIGLWRFAADHAGYCFAREVSSELIAQLLDRARDAGQALIQLSAARIRGEAHIGEIRCRIKRQMLIEPISQLLAAPLRFWPTSVRMCHVRSTSIDFAALVGAASTIRCTLVPLKPNALTPARRRS